MTVPEPSADGAHLSVLYAEHSVDGEKGLFSAARAAALRVGAVDVAQLSANLRAVSGQLSEIFHAMRDQPGPFELDEFEVTLELTAKGEVRLIGSAGSEIRGGVKLLFRRAEG
ncbi:hypothetical protein LQ51_15570 [Micromonospora sp. HK10]|nr:hypothetical protein LQ51_15570 [Micromonospora sp. HK10]